MAIKITITPSGRDGEPREQTFPKNEIRIGRGLYNDIVLDSLDVSTNHAILTVNETGDKKTLTISDLGSSSGTRLEGSPIPSRFGIQMSQSQRIEIGGFTLKVDFMNRSNEQNVPVAPTRERKATDLKGILRGQTREDSQQEQSLPYNLNPTNLAKPDSWRTSLFASTPETTTHKDAETKTPDEATSAAAESPQAYDENLETIEDSNYNNESTEETEETNKDHYDDVPPTSLDSFEDVDSTMQHDSVAETSTLPEPNPELSSNNYPPANNGRSNTSSSTHTANDSTILLDVVNVLELGDIEIDSTTSFDIFGTVLVGNRPVENVHITSEKLGNTATSTNGKFSFNQVSEDTKFVIEFDKPGYKFVPSKIEATLTSNQYYFVNGVEIVNLKGRVTRYGQGVADVKINLGNLETVKTAPDGSFCVTGIPANSFLRISFEKEMFVFEPSEWEGIVRPGSSSINVCGVQLISLTGRLLRAGKPLPGIEIEGKQFGRAITGQDGRYTFHNIREDMQASLSPVPGSKSFTLNLTPKKQPA